MSPSGQQTGQLTPAPPVGSLPPHLQRQQLRKVLLDQFRTKSQFEMLLDDSLSQPLDAVAGGANLTVVCFNLIQWLWEEPAERLKPFLAEAVSVRENSGELKEMLKAFGQVTPAPAPAPVADEPTLVGHPPLSNAARDQVIEFRTQFRQREKQFGYLKALKDLHDTLHDMNDLQGDLERCVEQGLDAARLNELRVIAEDVITLAVEAQEMVQGLEFPKDAAWVGTFAAAAGRLLSDKTDEVEQAVDDLRNLPAQNMARLDHELVNTLQRMNPTELVGTATAALDALAAEPTPPPLLVEFRGRLSGFTRLITRINPLADLHNTCQDIEVILAQKASAPNGLTAAALPAWGTAATAFARLTELRPDDRQTRNIAAAAAAFTTAPPADAAGRFATLLARFRKFFQDVDKELFDATGDLFNDAKLLGLQLRTLTNVTQ